ncbi:MAG TPA: Hsp20/alpha crystallin family protein [Candidatus Nitrosotalea sp.]|nr:Hsp20/alpha crystallin family protein [Candidatus Nitrosotalea sp.]
MDKPKKPDTSEHQLVPFLRQGWSDIDRIFDNMRRDFERSFSTLPILTIPPMSASLSCDVTDEGDRYVITADMPGISKEDVKLDASDSTLEISAEHKEHEEEKKKNYVRKERRFVSYHRTLPLSEKVDSSKAKAKLNNGILTIEVPKQSPTPKPKTINVQVQ